MKGKIHIGASGWSYKHWTEKFYPKTLKAADWLVFYSKTFKTAEINSSFYHLPARNTVISLTKMVPDEFLFCPKMSRFLTHMKKLNEPVESLENFFAVFRPMKKKLGPVLVQLPPNLGFNPMKT